MMIQVVSDEQLDEARAIELATEKKAISIFLAEYYATVCVKNAAHAAYRGNGRIFHGEHKLQQALNSYKDNSVKAMIETAIEMVG